MITAAITGHRPEKLGGYEPTNPMRAKIKAALKQTFEAEKVTEVISGMALGVDQWAAEVCVEIGLPFTAAIPFVGQETKWPRNSQEHYLGLLTGAAKKHVVCEGGYAAWKMQARNKWMVNNSHLLIAVWDGSSGGTANCVAYATQKDRRIVRISP